ncbi:hypothetical protein F5884DRAFT_848699 [Xylogone sp. PMI_703]|nr:hypothetical protein F5884DRAFT_848699 [Xylogone sp. PMI_703]
MATAPSRPNTNTDNKTTLSVALALALIALIIFLACVMNRLRPSDVSSRIWHPSPSDMQRQEGIEISTLDSIPTVIYRDELRSNANEQKTNIYDSAGILEAETLSKRPYQPILTTIQGSTDGDTTPSNLDGQEKHRSTTEEHRVHNGAVQCSICTEDLHDGEKVRILPCAHMYHRRCIDTWLLGFARSCPLCRVMLRDSAITPSIEPPRRALLTPGIFHRAGV